MRQTLKGQFKPRNPKKYKGDHENITYRSSWELKLMNWFDKHPDVIWWQSEELIVPYYDPMSKKTRRYFPDFVFERYNKEKIKTTYMVEVKPYGQTIEPVMKKHKKKQTMINEVMTFGTNKAKWEHAKAFCQQRKWQFMIITEVELKKMGLM